MKTSGRVWNQSVHIIYEQGHLPEMRRLVWNRIYKAVEQEISVRLLHQIWDELDED
jgi:hypothetical protein